MATKMMRAGFGLMLLAACGSTVTPPNTTPPAPATTTVSVTEGEQVEQFAFVRSIDVSEIRYDPAAMLTGEEAVEAARAEGNLAEGETLPNDYYISNPDSDESTATLDPDGSYTLIGFDADGALADRELSLEEMVAALDGTDSEMFYGIIPGDVPIILTLDGDVVVAARQQYLP